MKFVFFIPFLLLSFCLPANAQAILPVDENNKISFAAVVETDSLTKEQLHGNLENWLINGGYTIESNELDAQIRKIVATNDFEVFAKGYVSKKIHGKISYTLTIEIKDYKYCYNFSNFIFHYYKESRNYAMIPTGETKPLEEQKAPAWQTLWEAHKKLTKTTIEQEIVRKRIKMAKQQF